MGDLMDIDTRKMDIVENAIRKAKQIEAVGAAIAFLGEDNDKDQFLEWHGDQLGDVVRDLAKEVHQSLDQNWELIIKDQGDTGSLPHVPEDGSKEPEDESQGLETGLKIAHG